MEFNKDKVVCVIPSLNPDEKLIKLVTQLRESGLNNIFIVNDGSQPQYQPIFTQLKNINGVYLFNHFKNLGKGRALKNAFNQIFYVYPNFECVVTLDGDGQHAVEDVIKVSQEVFKNEDNLILGAREFGKDVPFRSKFGNILTRHIMKVLCGVNVRDTQTGLRGFSRNLLKNFLDTPGERYEYELNMLLATKEKGVEITQCPIQTIYIDDNASSHFNPIKDSIKIYSLFLKYIFVATISFVIDISLFALFVKIFKGVSYASYIYIATLLARIVSSFVNFLANKNAVFKNKSTSKWGFAKSLVQYYVLVAINIIVSGICVNYIAKALVWNETLIKLIVDCILFVINYIVQREFIFKNRRKK